MLASAFLLKTRITLFGLHSFCAHTDAELSPSVGNVATAEEGTTITLCVTLETAAVIEGQINVTLKDPTGGLLFGV